MPRIPVMSSCFVEQVNQRLRPYPSGHGNQVEDDRLQVGRLGFGGIHPLSIGIKMVHGLSDRLGLRGMAVGIRVSFRCRLVNIGTTSG